LAINAKYVHSSLAVWLIASGIKQYSEHQYDVNVVEATINQSLQEIVHDVVAYNPDVVGISTYIWNAGMLPDLLKELRKCLPNLIIVLGGPEASHNAEFWLSGGADHVVVGKGEYLFPSLLDELFNENSLSRHSVLDTESPIDPYSDEYFSTLNGRLSYIETSRGCPFRCSFCLSADVRLEYFSMDIVKSQIYKLSKANTKKIKFVDRTFNANADRAFEIFEYVINLDTPCRFHFEVAADLFDKRCLSLLSTAPAGKIQLEIGIQSFNEQTLKASMRKTNLEKVVQNITTLLSFQNIHLHIDLIAGLPYETLKDFKVGFNRACSLGTHNLQLGFLKLLHGSEMRKKADEYEMNFSENPPYEIIRNKWLSEKDLQELKIVENALQHTYNKGRFLNTIKYVLETSGLKPYDFMHALGVTVPSFGMQLEKYVVEVYNFFLTLPNVDKNQLLDNLVCDWLGMVKGKNAPQFLKNDAPERKDVLEKAERILGRKIRREQCAVLRSSNLGVVVDCEEYDPVTGLYKVFPVDL